MPAPRVRETIRLVLSIPLLVIGTLCALLAWQVAVLSAHNRWVAHTDEVIAATWRVAKLIIDHETGLRARLLSGDDAFLQPYEAARTELPAALNELHALVADNPPQQARIEDLRSHYEAWRRFAEDALSRSRATPTIVGPGTREDMQARKVEMDVMRGTVDAILSEENQLLAERQREARHTTRQVFVWGGGAGLVLGLLAALFLRRLVLSLDAWYAQALRAQAESLRTTTALAAEVTDQLRQAEAALIEARRGQG